MITSKWFIGTLSSLILSAVSVTLHIHAESTEVTKTDPSVSLVLSEEVNALDAVEDSVNEVYESQTSTPYLKDIRIPEIEVTTKLTLEEYMELDATTLSQMIRKGEVTSQELIAYAAQAIEKTNPELNNIITLRIDEALKEAESIKDTGQPFYGVPILVKGLGHTVKGGQNSNGIKFMEETQSRSDGRITKAFQSAGFIVIGQSSFPEMGWINVTNSELYGVTTNPWNNELNPGGSSGGSSAAVAIGQVPIATASDGGGSTRIPASWTGLIGLHPTRSSLSYDSNSSKQQVTNFAITKTMQDTKNLFEAFVKEPDKMEEGTIDTTMPIAYTLQTPAGTPMSEDAKKAVNEAVVFLKEKGFNLVEVDYPTDGKKLMEQYYTIAASNAGIINLLANQQLKRTVTIDDVELLTWALYETQKDLTKEDVAKAWDYISQVTKEMEVFYQNYPLFLTATTAYTAPPANYQHITAEMSEKLKKITSLSKEEKLKLVYDQWLPAWTLTPYTQLANLTGMPAISLPTYVAKNNSPLGIMFSTYAKNDRALLNLGSLFESAGKFKLYHQQQKAQWIPALVPEVIELSKSEDWIPALVPEVIELSKSEDWIPALVPEVIELSQSEDWIPALVPEVIELSQSEDWIPVLVPEVIELSKSEEWIQELALEEIEENRKEEFASSSSIERFRTIDQINNTFLDNDESISEIDLALEKNVIINNIGDLKEKYHSNDKLPNTGENNKYAIFGTTALSIFIGLGMINIVTKKKF